MTVSARKRLPGTLAEIVPGVVPVGLAASAASRAVSEAVNATIGTGA